MRQERLVGILGLVAGKNFSISGLFSVGRSPENTLPLDDSQVSRRHAVIEQLADGTILRDLGKFVRKASGQLGLLVGASHLLIAVSLRVGQILFRLRQIVFRLGEFRLGFGKVAERGDFGGMFVVALLGERGNLVGHFEIRNHASTEAGQNGNN